MKQRGNLELESRSISNRGPVAQCFSTLWDVQNFLLITGLLLWIMPQNVFKRAWLNRILKEEDLDGEVEKFEEDEELTIAKDFLQKEDIVHPLPRLSKNSPKKQSEIILFSSRLYYFLENKKKMKKKVHCIAFSVDYRIRKIVHCIAVHCIESRL